MLFAIAFRYRTEFKVPALLFKIAVDPVVGQYYIVNRLNGNYNLSLGVTLEMESLEPPTTALSNDSNSGEVTEEPITTTELVGNNEKGKQYSSSTAAAGINSNLHSINNGRG